MNIANKNKTEKCAFLLLIVSYMLPFDLARILQGIAWLVIAYLTIKTFKENKNVTVLILSMVIIIFIFILR